MGASFFSRSVDQGLGKLGLFHVRFMDDIVVLAPTQWKLRTAVNALNKGPTAGRGCSHSSLELYLSWRPLNVPAVER